MKLKKSSRSAAAPYLVDEMMDCYVTWREESTAVAAAYQAWRRATRDERWLGYAAYVAALDREERAAGEFRLLVEQVQRASGLGSEARHVASGAAWR